MRLLRKNHNLSHYLLPVILGVFFTGCSLLKRQPPPDPGFLAHEKELKALPERVPFAEAWIRDDKAIDQLKTKYKSIVILPVITDFIKEKYEGKDLPEGYVKDREEDAKELARYFQERMKVSFAEDNKLKVTEDYVPDSFVWEIAIIDLEPTEPAVSVVAAAAGAFIPGAGLLQRAASGSISIAGVIRDGNTGEIIAEFKDRQSDKIAPFTIKDFQMYAHARQAIDDWSTQFFKLATTNSSEKVEGSSAVTLSPF